MKEESEPYGKRIRIENVQSLGTENDLLIAKICDLQTEVLAQRAEIRQLTKAIATLSNFVKQSMRSIKINNVTQNCDDDFPISSEAKLLEVDGKISQDPASYVHAIKKLLSQGRTSRSIRLILCDDIILNYNIDGAKDKKRLKDFAHLFRAIMDAISQVEKSLPAERVLSKALRCVKNCAAKHKGKGGGEDPLAFLSISRVK
ncbi:uncharacterized protein LOC108024102 isoform X1 [Drosophila biarmipes]|uniref:uncharacterized protein LOC108024102 isoform X1 n=2 Tax=Drosophila biarmipes TaxID=125945 RepID=UPI0007E660B6|nr:uncharacterized protein LOC108024102 isoform X1 [Drosophila biarmipes]